MSVPMRVMSQLQTEFERYGGGGLVPRNGLRRLPLGFDSPRLHTFSSQRAIAWQQPSVAY